MVIFRRALSCTARGENKLTAVDAYWLGLVDEVIGESDLWTMRDLFEVQPDPPSDTELNEEAKESTEKDHNPADPAGAETGPA